MSFFQDPTHVAAKKPFCSCRCQGSRNQVSPWQRGNTIEGYHPSFPVGSYASQISEKVRAQLLGDLGDFTSSRVKKRSTGGGHLATRGAIGDITHCSLTTSSQQALHGSVDIHSIHHLCCWQGPSKPLKKTGL